MSSRKRRKTPIAKDVPGGETVPPGTSIQIPKEWRNQPTEDVPTMPTEHPTTPLADLAIEPSATPSIESETVTPTAQEDHYTEPDEPFKSVTVTPAKPSSRDLFRTSNDPDGPAFGGMPISPETIVVFEPKCGLLLRQRFTGGAKSTTMKVMLTRAPLPYILHLWKQGLFTIPGVSSGKTSPASDSATDPGSTT